MLGNTNQSNNKLLILKIRTQDAEKKKISPVFAVSQKNEDGKWAQTTEVKDVAGTLTKIETEKKEWEGQEYDVIKIFLQDDSVGETYLLDLRQNLLSRSIFNSLLSLSEFDGVSIGLYETKKDGETYAAVSVKRNGERVSWKYKLDELPKVKKVKVGKKEVVDSSEVDEFYIKELNSLGEVLASNKPAPVTKATVTVENEKGEEEDIPF